MSFLFTTFFFTVVGIVIDASPTVSPAPDVKQASRLQEGLPSSRCPSCSLSQMKRNLSSSGDQNDMVEAVKRHILNMLHLSARPNLTQPVPRAALLNAIKKLHVGRVAEDGSVEIQGEDQEGPQALTPPESASEVITFAEPGKFSKSIIIQVKVQLQTKRSTDCFSSCVLLSYQCQVR